MIERASQCLRRAAFPQTVRLPDQLLQYCNDQRPISVGSSCPCAFVLQGHFSIYAGPDCAERDPAPLAKPMANSLSARDAPFGAASHQAGQWQSIDSATDLTRGLRLSR